MLRMAYPSLRHPKPQRPGASADCYARGTYALIGGQIINKTGAFSVSHSFGGETQ